MMHRTYKSATQQKLHSNPIAGHINIIPMTNYPAQPQQRRQSLKCVNDSVFCAKPRSYAKIPLWY